MTRNDRTEQSTRTTPQVEDGQSGGGAAGSEDPVVVLHNEPVRANLGLGMQVLRAHGMAAYRFWESQQG